MTAVLDSLYACFKTKIMEQVASFWNIYKVLVLFFLYIYTRLSDWMVDFRSFLFSPSYQLF